MSQRGALFPWRTINGEEASPNFQQGTAQYHINADIAYAVMRYAQVEGSGLVLGDIGAQILVETARLWADLGFYGADERFHIHGVTGPDEYTTVVNDNAYTNLMARLNLNFAAATVRRLRGERPEDYTALVHAVRLQFKEVESWERAAAAMHIPFDEERGIHPQDDTFLDRKAWDLDATPREKFPLLLHYHPLVIYRHQVLKQADIVLAMFLLGDEFSEEQKRRNFDYYDPLTTGDSSLSACVQGIIAAEIGRERQALEYFQHALLMDLGNVAGNASTASILPPPPAYGHRSSSGSAASGTSAAACPSRPGCRAPGTSSPSHSGSAAGRSGSGSPTTRKATSLARAIHWRSSSGASPTCSARAPAWPSSSRRRDMDVRLGVPALPRIPRIGRKSPGASSFPRRGRWLPGGRRRHVRAGAAIHRHRQSVVSGAEVSPSKPAPGQSEGADDRRRSRAWRHGQLGRNGIKVPQPCTKHPARAAPPQQYRDGPSRTFSRVPVPRPEGQAIPRR